MLLQLLRGLSTERCHQIRRASTKVAHPDGWSSPKPVGHLVLAGTRRRPRPRLLAARKAHQGPSIPRPSGRQKRPEGRRAPLRHGAWAPRVTRQRPSPTPPMRCPNVQHARPWSLRPGAGGGTVARVGRLRRHGQTEQSGTARQPRGVLMLRRSGESDTQLLPATFGGAQ